MTDRIPRPALAGRVAIVTGSGRNIGRAIALAFAREGASVTVNGSANREAVDAVVAEIVAAGGRAIRVVAGAGDPSQVESLVSQTRQAFGQVDIAVSNVAQRRKQPFLDITVEDWNATLNSN